MRIASGISHTYSADNNWRRKSISVERTFKATGDMKALLEVFFEITVLSVPSVEHYWFLECVFHFVHVFDICRNCVRRN